MKRSDLPGEQLPVSRIEEVFDFRDPSFRAYLSMSVRGHPDRLRRVRDAMAGSDHPLVAHAAGWAAAELAVHRGQLYDGRLLPQITFAERVENLRTAQTLWGSLGSGMYDWRKSLSSQERELDARDIDARRRQALAYLPLMEVGASLLAYEPMSSDQIAWYRHYAREQSVVEGRRVLSLSAQNQLQRRTKAGLVAETICGLAGQLDERFHHLVLPASFRQDHSPERRFRADFIALSAEAPYRKTPMFVNSSEMAAERQRPCNRQHGVSFIADRDFKLGPEGSPRKTLEALIFPPRTLEPEQQRSIESLAITMTDRLDAFRQNYDA